MVDIIAPRTWTAGETLTDTLMNQEVRDRANQRVGDVLAAVTLGSSAAAIDFVQIPQGYAALELEVVCLSASTANTFLFAQFSANTSTTPTPSTGTLYDYYRMYTAGGTPLGDDFAGATAAHFGNIPSSTAPAGYMGAATVRIPNYAGSAYFKPYFSNSIAKPTASTGGSGGLVQSGGFWKSSSPLAQIRLFPFSGQFAAGAVATLRGLRSTSTSS